MSNRRIIYDGAELDFKVCSVSEDLFDTNLVHVMGYINFNTTEKLVAFTIDRGTYDKEKVLDPRNVHVVESPKETSKGTECKY